LKIKDIMTHNPITVLSSNTIAKAANLRLKNKVSGLPAADPTDNTLVGIITESDIFRLVVQTWDKIRAKAVE
jgi:CBS domain-containing protein